MKWITRSRPKTDRIACPWLIRRFIDPGAEILYVPASDVLRIADIEEAHSFDAPGARYDHRDGKCTFEVLIDDYDLAGDTALVRLASIVHAADIDSELRRDAGGRIAPIVSSTAASRLQQLGRDHGWNWLSRDHRRQHRRWVRHPGRSCFRGRTHRRCDRARHSRRQGSVDSNRVAQSKRAAPNVRRTVYPIRPRTTSTHASDTAGLWRAFAGADDLR